MRHLQLYMRSLFKHFWLELPPSKMFKTYKNGLIVQQILKMEKKRQLPTYPLKKNTEAAGLLKFCQ